MKNNQYCILVSNPKGGVYIKAQSKEEKLTVDEIDIMQLMGIGRGVAYEVISIMKSQGITVHQVGNNQMIHRAVFEKWLKGE